MERRHPGSCELRRERLEIRDSANKYRALTQEMVVINWENETRFAENEKHDAIYEKSQDSLTLVSRDNLEVEKW